MVCAYQFCTKYSITAYAAASEFILAYFSRSGGPLTRHAWCVMKVVKVATMASQRFPPYPTHRST